MGFTPFTKTDPDAIRRELEQVRRDGFATDREEFVVGVCCIAVPLRDATDHVAAIMSTAFPSTRSTRTRMAELTSLLVEAAAAANARLHQAGVSAPQDGVVHPILTVVG